MLETPQKLMKSFHIDPGGQRSIGSGQSVSTQTINFCPAPLANCSRPFQQGSYFSARPSLLVRQSEFHLLIGDFFNLLCSEGPWRRRLMFSHLCTASCQQDDSTFLPWSFSGSIPSRGLEHLNAKCSHSHCRQKPHIHAFVSNCFSIMCSDKPNNVPND